jgi:hypothetical protein
MRLQLILPQVNPTAFKKPLVCPHKGCQGRYFEHHQWNEAERISLSSSHRNTETGKDQAP